MKWMAIAVTQPGHIIGCRWRRIECLDQRSPSLSRPRWSLVAFRNSVSRGETGALVRARPICRPANEVGVDAGRKTVNRHQMNEWIPSYGLFVIAPFVPASCVSKTCELSHSTPFERGKRSAYQNVRVFSCTEAWPLHWIPLTCFRSRSIEPIHHASMV